MKTTSWQKNKIWQFLPIFLMIVVLVLATSGCAGEDSGGDDSDSDGDTPTGATQTENWHFKIIHQYFSLCISIFESLDTTINLPRRLLKTPTSS